MTDTGKEYAARFLGTGWIADLIRASMAELIDMALADAKVEAAVAALVPITGESVCTGCGADVTEHHTWEQCADNILAAQIVPTIEAPPERGLKPGDELCQQCGAVVDAAKPHTWKDCAAASYTDYECENGHRCEVESALQEEREARKQVIAELDAALNYIEHIESCAVCDNPAEGLQPSAIPLCCENCQPETAKGDKWKAERERLRALVEAALDRRAT